MEKLMKPIIRTIIVMAVTLAIIISIFWFILPQTGLPEKIGSAYFIVSLLGPIVISYLVSWGLNIFLASRR